MSRLLGHGGSDPRNFRLATRFSGDRSPRLGRARSTSVRSSVLSEREVGSQSLSGRGEPAVELLLI
jgi:hypothetical protein